MRFKRRAARVAAACLATGMSLGIMGGTAQAAAPVPDISACEPGGPCATPLPVKVVVVTLFEIGEDTGDTPGEFQLWKERRNLSMRIPFPQGFHDLYYDPETQMLVMVTGVGTARSAGAAMAVGLDQRFDLKQAYWLVAGIAGIDPEDASIGSAAWARWVVDGDLAHEIDAREMPKDWKTGFFPRHTKGPNDRTTPIDISGGEVVQLNPALTSWAFNLTKDIKLPDSPQIAKERARFKGYPNAQKPPFVLEGEQLSAMTFWHGKLLTDWANYWVDYWTEGKGEFVTSAMEDSGILQSMNYLDKIGRVDKDRVMVLRAGSNYSMPPPGEDAAKYLLQENEGYAGLYASTESLYLVGSKVVDELIGNWDTYRDTPPQ